MTASDLFAGHPQPRRRSGLRARFTVAIGLPFVLSDRTPKQSPLGLGLEEAGFEGTKAPSGFEPLYEALQASA